MYLFYVPSAVDRPPAPAREGLSGKNEADLDGNEALLSRAPEEANPVFNRPAFCPTLLRTVERRSRGSGKSATLKVTFLGGLDATLDAGFADFPGG
jgi:hypothetical protein